MLLGAQQRQAREPAAGVSNTQSSHTRQARQTQASQGGFSAPSCTGTEEKADPTPGSAITLEAGTTEAPARNQPRRATGSSRQTCQLPTREK